MAKRSVYVFIDALSWEAAELFGFLDRYGNRVATQTVLGFSSAATATILTGLKPEKHGVWLMYLRRPESSPFKIARLLSVVFKPGRGEYRLARPLIHLLASRTSNVLGYFNLYSVPLRLLPEFDVSSRRYPFQPGAFAPHTSVFDLLRDTGSGWRVWDWRVPEDRAFAELEDAVRRGRDQFLFLYTPALDALMHAEGPYADAVKRRLGVYEKRIERLIELCESTGTVLNVFSDQGMQQTRGSIDIMTRIERSRWVLGTDYLAFYDSSVARFWFHNDAARAGILGILSDSSHGRILEVEEEKRLGVFFPDRRYGDVIYLCDPGFLIVPSYMSSKPLKGMHGFHPEHRESFGFFFSTGSSAPPPGSIADLFHTMRRAITE